MSDRVDIRFDLASGGLDSPEAQSDGSVIYTGRVARIGSHSYPWGIERRDSHELECIVDQLAGIPVTAMHPGKLLSLGGQARIVGKIVSARMDGDHAIARIHVGREGVALIDAGLHELSLGYSTKAVNGNHTNTRVDHLALVVASRCGTSCSVRMDCAGCSAGGGGGCNGNCNGGCECKNSRGGFSEEVQITNQLIAMKGK